MEFLLGPALLIEKKHFCYCFFLKHDTLFSPVQSVGWQSDYDHPPMSIASNLFPTWHYVNSAGEQKYFTLVRI